jgi:hypothetical protein
MLRTLILTLAIATPGVAAAQDFQGAVVGTEVRADNGTVLGHVTAAQRDRHGRVVSVEIPGLEPPDAATVLARNMVADADTGLSVRVVDRRASMRDRSAVSAGSVENARLR